MRGERLATVGYQVAIWTRYTLVAVAWLVIADAVGFVFLGCLGLFDAAGPNAIRHHLGIVGHAFATGPE